MATKRIRDSMVKDEAGESTVKLEERRMDYVSLHHHSTYSFLDGYGHPADHIDRAAELGMGALALTEHGNVSSHPKLEQAAISAGVKPLFGCELYCGEGKVQRKNHLTVIAEDEEGYRDLLRMVSWAWTDDDEGGGFYYEPTVNGSTFARYSSRLMVASGCTGSLLATSLIGGKNIRPEDASYKRGLGVASRFKELLGDRYYLEVQAFPKLDATRAINPLLARLAKRLAIPLVATQDVHYCRPEDSKMQTILHACRPGGKRTYEDQAKAWGYDIKLTHPISDNDMLRRLVETGLTKQEAAEAVGNSAAIAERCTVALPKAAPLKYPSTRQSYNIFKEWLKAGWSFRNIGSKDNVQAYAERLKYEVSIIEEKEFIDYFLIVSDMTRWAKNNGIFVGPARGSAAASLVCYLLRITEVDPMDFGHLVFERFIDITRRDLPDIDLDFDDARRVEVFDYLRRKYGEAQVNQLGSFTTYKSKLALDDVARVFNIPKWEVDKVKEVLIERSSGDLRASATIEDTVANFPQAAAVFEQYPDLRNALALEGMVKGMGKHAAGAVVASSPITDVCAVYGGSTSVDKYDAEHLNLLKIDVLGLSTAGMLAEAAQMIGMDIEDYYDIPLDDEETLAGFQENDVTAIFQFDGRAMRLVNKNLVPDDFEEVCLVTALARPGPLHNNATADYIDIKHGSKESPETHPLFDDICKSTYYQVVYQEQILRIVREIGNFDWTAAAYIRKIISRKIGDQEFNRQWDRFWKGAKENGLSEELAKDIWGLCITAGSYAFNAAHSVSYGYLAWWCMWMKRHYPTEFYTSALRRLSAGDKGMRHLDIMRDALKHGVKVLPPSPTESGVDWELVNKHEIRAGFVKIPGVGIKTAADIVEYRETAGLEDWEDLIHVKGIGPKTILNIMEWVNQEDPLGVEVLNKKLMQTVVDIERGIKDSSGSLLPMPTHSTADIPFGRSADTEVVWIGIIVHRNLRDLFEVNFKKTGVPLDPSKVRDAEKREWLLLYGTDGDEMVTLNIDRWKYPRFKEMAWKIRMGQDLVLIRGVKKGMMPQRVVHIRDMWVLGD